MKKFSLFSQRKGYRPLQKTIQRESIDEELRNRLWSAIKLIIWDHWSPPDILGYQSEEAKQIEVLLKLIWMNYFKWPIDTLAHFDEGYPKSAYEILREYFFKAKWWEVYDFIEFILKHIPQEWKEDFRKVINKILEDENAAYRIVGDEIVEITDETEIAIIEEVLDLNCDTVKQHLNRALDLFSDKRNPDYRNAIKEAISAVEATCQIISGKSRATLGDCLKVLKKKQPFHPAFEQALSKLYGYTNDEGGIRHALTEESILPSFADAKFMLVACSAFVNYLWTKAAELDIEIKKP